jgi:hypothetical protein
LSSVTSRWGISHQRYIPLSLGNLKTLRIAMLLVFTIFGIVYVSKDSRRNIRAWTIVLS